MIQLDTRRMVERLKTIESLAVVPRLASTNLVARRIVAECIENELSLPQAMIIAGEQFAGIGRNARSWSSPPDKGIYATTLLTRPVTELPLVPLAIANIVVTYLRDMFSIEARIKWPNDILVDGRKIAGILIEARVQDDRLFLIIGIGINVEPFRDESRPNAIAISEVSPRDFSTIDSDGPSIATRFSRSGARWPSTNLAIAFPASSAIGPSAERGSALMNRDARFSAMETK